MLSQRGGNYYQQAIFVVALSRQIRASVTELAVTDGAGVYSAKLERL